MCLTAIIKTLSAEIVASFGDTPVEFEMVCASDLMSDVLAFSKSKAMLVTGLTNPQTVRTAEITEIVAICFVHGKRPQAETIELAIQSEITLLMTPYSMFETCGRLYCLGLTGCDRAG